MGNLTSYPIFNKNLSTIDDSSNNLITTLNAHSYNVAINDTHFREALMNSDILLPDGVSITWAVNFLQNKKIKKIAGADLFMFEMKRLQKMKGRCFFLGSTQNTLDKIENKIRTEYPDVRVGNYSPPFKNSFSKKDSQKMIDAVNTFNPHVLFIGLTAPKQEKWAYRYKNQISANHICCIGAVFDFYAGNTKRAPKWVINLGLEWLCRLISEPRRLWKRYLLGNIKFLYFILKEKYKF